MRDGAQKFGPPAIKFGKPCFCIHDSTLTNTHSAPDMLRRISQEVARSRSTTTTSALTVGLGG
jgi:hypothetical protein